MEQQPREPAKTDRIRGWSRKAKPRKTLVNKGRLDSAPHPHRGDRGGDTPNEPQPRAIVLEKRFERHQREAPFHHSTSFRRVPTTVSRKNHGLFCSRGQTSCDFNVRSPHDDFLIHYYLLTSKFLLIDTHVSRFKIKKEKSSSGRAL